MPGFQTKALVVVSRGMCAPTKLNFESSLMLFQTSTKLKFGLSDVLVITAIARNRMKTSVSCSFVIGSLGLAKTCPKV